MSFKNICKVVAIALACTFAFASGTAFAQSLRISAGVGQQHFWVGEHMDPFADAIEAQTDIEFVRFYAGSLVSMGRELDALKGGTIDVAAPLPAPYHEGRFPLSDVTQLPTYDTNSQMVTRAFQKLLDSDVELVDGKTFYEYEISDKQIKAWAVGATAPYSMSTTGAELRTPSDLDGFPMRAGSALHTMVLQQLGATPVTMTSSQSYEALARGTIDGTILSIADWPSYSLGDLLEYTITGVSLGHWESYLSITEALWNELSAEEREIWDRTARRIGMENAKYIDEKEKQVRATAKEGGASFVPVTELPPEMGAHIAEAASDTWIQWIEQLEANGHPGQATAELWAKLITAEDGRLPDGVAEYLETH